MYERAFRTAVSHRPKGFSLIELVFVIVIIGVVSAIALPHWSSVSKTYQLDLAARRLASDLMFAESRANYTSTSVTVSFKSDSGIYQIQGVPDPERPGQTYTVNLAADPYGVIFQSPSFGSQLTFDGYGNPAAGGSIVLAIGTRQKTVGVDANSGRVWIQ